MSAQEEKNSTTKPLLKMKPRALKIGKGLPRTHIICPVLKKIVRRQKDKTFLPCRKYFQTQGTNAGSLIRDYVSASLIKDLQMQKKFINCCSPLLFYNQLMNLTKSEFSSLTSASEAVVVDY